MYVGSLLAKAAVDGEEEEDRAACVESNNIVNSKWRERRMED